MRKPLVFVALPPRLYGLFFSPEVVGRILRDDLPLESRDF